MGYVYAFLKPGKQKEQSMELEQLNTFNFFPGPPTIIFGSLTFDSPVVSFSGWPPLLPAERERCMLDCQITMSQGENENHALDRGGGELRAKKFATERQAHARGRASLSMTFLLTQFLRIISLFLFT